jgi:hypothetical protein
MRLLGNVTFVSLVQSSRTHTHTQHVSAPVDATGLHHAHEPIERPRRPRLPFVRMLQFN